MELEEGIEKREVEGMPHATGAVLEMDEGEPHRPG